MNIAPSIKNSDSSPATRSKTFAVSTGKAAETNGAPATRANLAQIDLSQPAAGDDDMGGKFPMKIRFHPIACRAGGKRVVRN